MQRRFGLFANLFVLLILAGCTAVSNKPLDEDRAPPTVEVIDEPEWHRVATDPDIARIQDVARAWDEALHEARARGFRRAVSDEGELLDPAAALPRPDPSPGPYRCRVIKLGTQGRSGLAFSSYKPFFCYVQAEGPLLTIVKQTGSQRPAGRLYPDEDANRLVFLGTLALGSEESPLPYGERPERDMAGVLERVGPFRYRLVIPWPRKESKLDVMELIPVVPTE